jgi:phage terminase small subunit
MFHKGKKNIKFSMRQLRFLELYLSGFTLKDSARGAGYQGSSDQSLCNTGAAILCRAVANDARIASLLINMAVESKKMKYFTILSKALFSRR